MRRLDQALAAAAISAIRVYQVTLGFLVRGCCRFEPSCSRYAIEALRRFGAVRGSVKALGRLLRCHPFHPGGADPVR